MTCCFEGPAIGLAAGEGSLYPLVCDFLPALALNSAPGQHVQPRIVKQPACNLCLSPPPCPIPFASRALISCQLDLQLVLCTHNRSHQVGGYAFSIVPTLCLALSPSLYCAIRLPTPNPSTKQRGNETKATS